MTAPCALAAGLINTAPTTPSKLSAFSSPPTGPDGMMHTTEAEVEEAEAAGHH